MHPILAYIFGFWTLPAMFFVANAIDDWARERRITKAVKQYRRMNGLHLE